LNGSLGGELQIASGATSQPDFLHVTASARNRSPMYFDFFNTIGPEADMSFREHTIRGTVVSSVRMRRR
jgi:hypothetical protein